MTAAAVGLYHNFALWSAAGVLSVLLFFLGFAVFFLKLRQKRPVGAAAAAVTILLAYGEFQCIAAYINNTERSLEAAQAVEEAAGSIPDWALLVCCAVTAAADAILLAAVIARRKNRITLTSIKEATDSLPMGILCYAPDGRILLVNRAMERFGKMLTGDLLTDGAKFAERLHSGQFQTNCRIVDTTEAPVIRLYDGSVWTVSEECINYDNKSARAVMAADITDAYGKTLELRRIQEQVAAMGAGLARTNREIVALTVEQELLAAKVKIHDELGQNLLFIRRLILGGRVTEQEKAEMSAIAKRLHANIEFLKSEADAATDEYELMIDTAARLGVEVAVTGKLPQEKELKHIIAAGIHECFTNTLRHAHGDRLNVRIDEDEEKVAVAFTNNGEQPTGEICEKGGLRLLRDMTERAGGKMTVSVAPTFTVTLELPKEE